MIDRRTHRICAGSRACPVSCRRSITRSVARAARVAAFVLSPTLALSVLHAATSSPTIRFADITAESGLRFLHFNGMTGRLYYPEVVGSGGALLDYDNDGDLDLFLVQGALLGLDRQLTDAVFPWTADEPPSDRLFRNELEPGRSAPLRFSEVTEESKITSAGYGMGAAAADYDNDGFVDLYVLNFGRNELWRNRGDGTFEEVAERAGVADARWSVAASFADYDADGHLDLFVANYLDFSLLQNKQCLTERGEPDYCLPNSFRPSSDALFRNRGDGTFEDVSQPSGIARVAGNGLGVVAGDFDGDFDIDFYVANDLMANHLWINQGNGTFVDDALLAGAALSREGKAEASMGIAVGDFDADFDLDLFLTHFNREKNTLYVQTRRGEFADESVRFGLAGPSYAHTAFGTAFADFDRDGDLDLFAANGAVVFPPGIDRTRHPFPLDETNQVFCNLAREVFEDCTAAAGPALAASAVSRGAIAGDLDNDGDLDLVVTNNSAAPQLLENRSEHAGGWLAVEAVVPLGKPSASGMQRSRLALGTALRLVDDPWRQWRVVQSDGGYASARDARVIFALDPTRPGPWEVEVHWPNGKKEIFGGLAPSRHHRIVQGRGNAAAPSGAP